MNERQVIFLSLFPSITIISFVHTFIHSFEYTCIGGLLCARHCARHWVSTRGKYRFSPAVMTICLSHDCQLWEQELRNTEIKSVSSRRTLCLAHGGRAHIL